LGEIPVKSILLVEDEDDVRASLKNILEIENYNVLEAATYSAAIKQLKHHIDLALIDYVLPARDGLELIKYIRKTKPFLPVIMITGHGTEDVAIKAFRTGATDYIKKPLNIPYLIQKIAGILLSSEGEITSREKEVIKCLKIGKTDSEIASIFNISEHTAKFHIKNILRKLNASNRCHALSIAAQKGLIKI